MVGASSRAIAPPILVAHLSPLFRLRGTSRRVRLFRFGCVQADEARPRLAPGPLRPMRTRPRPTALRPPDDAHRRDLVGARWQVGSSRGLLEGESTSRPLNPNTIARPTAAPFRAQRPGGGFAARRCRFGRPPRRSILLPFFIIEALANPLGPDVPLPPAPLPLPLDDDDDDQPAAAPGLGASNELDVHRPPVCLSVCVADRSQTR